VGYGQLTGGTPKATFFSCESPYKKWEVNKMDQPPYGMTSIGFIKDEYTFMTTGGLTESYSLIWDINHEKEIYRTNKYGSSLPIFNPKYNSIIVGGIGYVSLDFNKILNSVSVDEPNEPILKFISDYRNGILMISGIESNSQEINLSINDIQGNMVFQNRVKQVSDIIEIPIKLQSGVYILQIQDGNNYHSENF
ncbi:MAG: T9SS type A sorting domain-containing protein, partial [Candidatus Kapabacteria bacterium]|nr:T9SS type A sorting domain-containing protein [Candidatus Kapabacteria bacterium]